jgi:hypothetical protein
VDQEYLEEAQRDLGLSKPWKQLSTKSKIAVALTALALKRHGEWSKKALHLFAAELSKLPVDSVLAVIEQIGSHPRYTGDSALPDYGTLLTLIRDVDHPLRHLREAVRKIADNFECGLTEERLELYVMVAGHRTDEDIDTAVSSILRSKYVTKMPTTGQFLEACGILRRRRDGKRID